MERSEMHLAQIRIKIRAKDMNLDFLKTHPFRKKAHTS